MFRRGDGGAKKVATHWQQVTGTPIVQAYGLSETSPALTINLLDDDFNGSVGLPVSSTTITIRDEQGKILPIDNVGEICAEGPQVMREYWNKPRETQKVFWQDEKGNANILRTGDMGRIDSTGRVFLVDRLKDMIVVSGFKVFPNEVEDVLAAHPAVLECGVVGVSDNRTGEAVKAYIVKRSQHLLTADDLDQYCHQYLTNYKVPKYFQFIETLPKNNVGKVLRKSLKDMQ